MDTVQWFVLASDGKEYPADSESLRSWILERRISGRHHVRPGSSPHWVKASDLPELRPFFQELQRSDEAKAVDFIMTTETVLMDRRIVRRIEVVSAECALGMNLLLDVFAGLRDIFGGRSKATQDILRDTRRTALNELRQEAIAVGANAVIGVDLDYSEFSGGGKSMLFLVASGTAVVLEEHDPAPPKR